MAYILTVILFGQVFVIDQNLTRMDCEAYQLQLPFQCVKEIMV